MESLTADVEVCLDARKTQAINGCCVGMSLLVHSPSYAVSFFDARGLRLFFLAPIPHPTRSKGAAEMSKIDQQIEAAKARVEKLDEKIGRMMSDRVTAEDKLAALYARRDGPSRLTNALNTIMAPGFGS
jgi:hypothetical protein